MELCDRWVLDVCCVRRDEDDTPDFCEDCIDIDVCLMDYGKCEFLIMEPSEGVVMELEDD